MYDYIKCKKCDSPLLKVVIEDSQKNYELKKYIEIVNGEKPNYDYICKNEKCREKYENKDIFKNLPLLFNKKILKNEFEKGIEIVEYPDLKIDFELLKNYANKLQNEILYEEIPSKDLGNGHFSMGYISYNSQIFELKNIIPFYEKSYENIEKIKNKDISLLTFLESQKYITFIFRGEKFCEGHIKEYIENGVLLRLINHILEIYNKLI